MSEQWSSSPQGEWGGQPGGYRQPSYPQGGYPQGYGAPPLSTGKATASLILGIAGLLCLGIFGNVPAIILGMSFKKDAAAYGPSVPTGTATTGIVLGWISVALSLIGIVFVILVLAGGSSSGS